MVNTLRSTLLFTSSLVLLSGLAACTTKPAATTAPVAQTPTTPDAPRTASNAPIGTSPLAGIRPGSEQDFVINVGDRVYFDSDRSDVRTDARAILDSQADWLKRYPGVRIRIEGNCDERGTREYNLALGARRAQAAMDYLVSRGVVPARIDTISYGKERPIEAGADGDAWQKNRNAHSTVTGGAI